MNTIINFEPENLTVEEKILTEIRRAADVVGKIYSCENCELNSADVMRHDVVSKIIDAYNLREKNEHDNKF